MHWIPGAPVGPVCKKSLKHLKKIKLRLKHLIHPSAENISRWLFGELATLMNSDNARLKRVEIKEFDDCGAAYFE